MKDLKKIKMLIALPRFECCPPGMVKDQFRALQKGETVAVNALVADKLAADGFVEIVDCPPPIPVGPGVRIINEGEKTPKTKEKVEE